ncbi:MAG: methyltransferase [Bdellovibrionota bacterium]
MKAYAKQNGIEYDAQDGFFPLRGSDISKTAVNVAHENAKNAGVEELVSIFCGDVAESKPHASCGLILINPPYGERIGANPQLYKSVGDGWKKNFPKWTAWLLSSNESLTKSVGLRSTRKFSVYNGNLECRFLQYVMY